MNYSKLLLLIGIIVLLFMAVYTYDTLENFENLLPQNQNRPYPLLESYPIIGDGLVNEHTKNLWKNNQIPYVPSYSQTTNNIKYPINPDIGDCIALEFCNTIYGNNTQLGKEANESIRSSHNMNDVRVGYFYQHT